jgi:Leucine-rich repeat (LRR) protein/ribosomal protein L21E
LNKRVLISLLIVVLVVGVACTRDINYRLNTEVLEGSGTIKLIPDKEIYKAEQEVKVEAIPTEGYQFAGWKSGLNGDQPEQTITMTEDITIGAKFTKQSAPIIIEKSGKGNVEIKPADYKYGEEVKLIAKPDTSSSEIWKFKQWSGDIEDKENPKEMIAENINLRAEFVRYYNQVTEVSGEGSIELKPDQKQYKRGTSVEIIANPADNWQLKEWAGDLAGTKVDKEIIVEDTNFADRIEIKANFEKQTGNLITNTTEGGTIKIDPIQEDYNVGDTITITADANEGYHFVNWTGDISGDQASKEITVDNEMSIKAVFEINNYQISSDVIGEGTVTGTGSYDYGAQVELSAKPDTSSSEIWKFEGWRGAKNSSDSPLVFKATEDLNIEAEFVRYYNKSTNISGSGSISLSPDKDQYKHGEEIEVTANAADGAKFKEWSGDLSGTKTVKKIRVENTTFADRIEIKANFVELYYIDTASEGSGKITLTPDKEYYSEGEEVTIKAEGINEYSFAKWIGDQFNGAQEAIQTVNITENMNIKSLFEVPLTLRDEELEKEIRDELNKSTGDIYPSDFSSLEELYINSTNSIKDISPLAKADLSNLIRLDLSANNITNISTLAEADLPKLNELYLSSNPVNMKQLASVMDNLNNLGRLRINNNDITDISSLVNSDLSKLNNLELENTGITDISLLAETDLSGLDKISLSDNGNIKYQWVVDKLESSGISVDTSGCNIINKDKLNDLLETVNKQTSFMASGSYDAENYPYGVIMQVHGSGETYTIYLEEALGGMAHLNHDLDEIDSRYECISRAE